MERRTLSLAGREILLKSVLQSIPAYTMSSFLIPSSLGEEIQRMMNSFWWGANGEARRGIKWLSWDHLTSSKHHGGMGFRNLYAFNLAMLGKQGWRFISDPDAMITKFFKAKYFPRTTFLDSQIGHNPSYTWRSIWCSRVLLNEGYRWCIGDGSDVRVWLDPWVRGIASRFLQSVPPADFLQMKVKDLMIQDTKNWNQHLISNLMCPADIEAVFRTPIMGMIENDRILWEPNTDGKYTVKLGYHVCMRNLMNSEQMAEEGDWMIIWKLNVPPRVTCFLWRACKDCIPTRSRLQSKGVPCPLSCVCCQVETENSWHLFLTCSKSVDCWVTENYWHIIEPFLLTAENFKSVFFQVAALLNGDRRSLFAMILWSLWKSRNAKLWEDQQETSFQVLSRARLILHEWSLANTPYEGEQQNNPCPNVNTWCKPPIGWLKCNVDASFSQAENKTGIGICFRDDQGRFIMAKTISLSPVLQICEGEGMGLLEALKWGRQLGYLNVIYELDSQTVVHSINNHKENLSELGAIIRECRSVISDNANFVVKFSRRQANVVAHTLARVAISLASPTIYLSIPSCIESFIISEMK